MPRARPIFPIAVSIQAASDALDCPRRVVADAVRVGELPAYAGPGRRIRITVADLVEWVRTWPRATKRSKPNERT
jgi:excisionase family DNA binding protein